MLKKGLIFLFLFFLIFLIPSSNSIVETVHGPLYFTVTIVPNQTFYLIPLIYTDQNLVKTQANNITIEVFRVEVNNTTNKTLEDSATVNGSITSPSGSVDSITFDNQGNGNYTYNYTFNQIGTYRVDIRAEVDYAGYSLSQTFIYVGLFPIYANIRGATEYKSGESADIIIYVEDDQGNPIVGGSGNVTIYYPNHTAWVSNQAITQLNNGIYYYNFTAPSTTGVYSIFLNFSSGSNFDTDAKTFHIAEWTEDITSISSTVGDIETVVGLINTTVQAYRIVLYGGGGTYNPSESIHIVANLVKEGSYVSGQTLNITIYYPNGLKFRNTIFDDVGSGIYSYNLSAPSTVGDYRVDVFIGSVSATSKFTVSTIESFISRELEDLEDDISDDIKDSTENINEFILDITKFLNSTFMQGVYIILIGIAFLTVIVLIRRFRESSEEGEEGLGEVPPTSQMI